MWIHLERDELDFILKSIPEGPLAGKLRKSAHPDTPAFASAVRTNDDLEVDRYSYFAR